MPRGATRRQPQLSYARRRSGTGFVALALEVDDDVADGDLESLPRVLDDPALEPVRAVHGWVEMMISSAPKVRRASAIACSGFASPTSPEASIPSERSRSRLASRRPWAAARALSSSDVQCRSRELSAGVQTRISVGCRGSVPRSCAGGSRRRLSRSRRRGSVAHPPRGAPGSEVEARRPAPGPTRGRRRASGR